MLTEANLSETSSVISVVSMFQKPVAQKTHKLEHTTVEMSVHRLFELLKNQREDVQESGHQ